MGDKHKKCLICGHNRAVDRCHLIPRRIVKGIVGLRRFERFSGMNVIFLCKNHHALFDSFRLTRDEWEIIIQQFESLWKYIDMLENSDLIPANKCARRLQKKKEGVISRWLERINEIRFEYG